MEEKKVKRTLTTLDDLFGPMNNFDNKKSIELDINILVPFSKHPFNLYTNERFEDMVRSIKTLGIIFPIIVRPFASNGKYEILSGHNRWNAAKKIGLKTVPTIIMDSLNDEEAMLIVTETNLMQRSFDNLLYSERAFVLAQHYNALEKQGKSIELIKEIKNLLDSNEINNVENESPLGTEKMSYRKIAHEYSLSKNSVARYLRINTLHKYLKELIDLEELSIRAGVELSYLSVTNQNYLVTQLNIKNSKISIFTASALKKLELSGKLNQQSIQELLSNCNPKPKSISNGFRLKPKLIQKYFTEKQNTKEVEEVIDKALEQYFHTQE